LITYTLVKESDLALDSLGIDDKQIQNGKKFFDTLANPLLRRNSSTMQELALEYAGTFYLYYASGGR